MTHLPVSSSRRSDDTPRLVYASLEGTVSKLEGEPGTRIVRVRPLTAG